MIDLRSPQAVPAVDEIDLFCNTAAVSDGAVAVHYAEEYLAENR